MPMLSGITYLLKSNFAVFKALRRAMAFFGYFKHRLGKTPDAHWRERITTVLSAPDNADIARVPGAGDVVGDCQVMHNGVRIHLGSYYGDGMTSLLFENKGVHEPQEEKAFAEVLRHLPPKPAMLELGAFWGFYSLTFRKSFPEGQSYLIEPDRHALQSGKHNFRLNNLHGKFFNYYVSDRPAPGKIPVTTVDEFLNTNNISKLHVLHSDIQGFESKMLRGAESSLREARIDFIFISTHSNSLHEECKQFLSALSYIIVCDADLDESFSEDGLIVAKHKNVRGPERINIHLRK